MVTYSSNYVLFASHAPIQTPDEKEDRAPARDGIQQVRSGDLMERLEYHLPIWEQSHPLDLLLVCAPLGFKRPSESW